MDLGLREQTSREQSHTQIRCKLLPIQTQIQLDHLLVQSIKSLLVLHLPNLQLAHYQSRHWAMVHLYPSR